MSNLLPFIGLYTAAPNLRT